MTISDNVDNQDYDYQTVCELRACRSYIDRLALYSHSDCITVRLMQFKNDNEMALWEAGNADFRRVWWR